MQLKFKVVTIGDREFSLKELTCADRNVLAEILSSVKLPDILSQLLLSFDHDSIKPEMNFFEILKTGGVWENIVGIMIQALGMSLDIICLSIKQITEEEEKYVRLNLTISQESEILNDIVELNSLPDVIKNYTALLRRLKEVRRA
jgi:hypothetical protein